MFPFLKVVVTIVPAYSPSDGRPCLGSRSSRRQIHQTRGERSEPRQRAHAYGVVSRSNQTKARLKAEPLPKPDGGLP